MRRKNHNQFKDMGYDGMAMYLYACGFNIEKRKTVKKYYRFNIYGFITS